ncbi:hypothetical protein TNCV_3278911 [Trichonephila clavipes]|nr:hypothetical protein TNCV_3278911 [Trichonephila clavipes]
MILIERTLMENAICHFTTSIITPFVKLLCQREESSSNMTVRSLGLHLATGRTRDDIEKRIWQRQRREKGRNGGEERGGEEKLGREK